MNYIQQVIGTTSWFHPIIIYIFSIKTHLKKKPELFRKHELLAAVFGYSGWGIYDYKMYSYEIGRPPLFQTPDICPTNAFLPKDVFPLITELWQSRLTSLWLVVLVLIVTQETFTNQLTVLRSRWPAALNSCSISFLTAGCTARCPSVRPVTILFLSANPPAHFTKFSQRPGRKAVSRTVWPLQGPQPRRGSRYRKHSTVTVLGFRVTAQLMC